MFLYLRSISSAIITTCIDAITPTLRRGLLMSLILAVIGILFIPIETLTALSLANLQVMGRYFVILIFGVFYLAELLAAVIGNHLSMTTVQHVTHQNIDN